MIILGMFIMQWTAQECLNFFERFATSVFRRRGYGQTVFARLQELLVSYITDCKYDSAGIEAALKMSFGEDVKLFNPLKQDTKVAVTSTTARESMPCLFANYNGGIRPKNAGKMRKASIDSMQ